LEIFSEVSDIVRKLQDIVRQANLIMYESIFGLTIEVQSVIKDFKGGRRACCREHQVI